MNLIEYVIISYILFFIISFCSVMDCHTKEDKFKARCVLGATLVAPLALPLAVIAITLILVSVLVREFFHNLYNVLFTKD